MLDDNKFIFGSNKVIVDEFTRIVKWLTKIGESEVLVSEISKNGRKAREVVELLGKYELISCRRRGRLQLVSLSPRGLEVYRHILSARRIIYGEPLARREFVQRLEEAAGGAASVADTSSELPSFLRDNPWLEVLASRSRSRVFG
ncbi:MAG: hypothetical protein LM590_00440 [Thermofilum sp.]|jgi:hypothetical protein|nr:hypothetical protein [Thermofilum sp.]